MKGGLIVLTVGLLALFVSAQSASLKTSEREKAIEEIIRNSFQDPVNLGNFSVGPGDGVLRVNQNVTNMIVTGLSKARRTVHADLAGGLISLVYEADQLIANVGYDIDGYCLLLKIWGSGKGVVVMNDVRVTADATIELVNDKIKINDMKITYGVSGGSFDLDSLFGETGILRILTRSFLKVLNANNQYVFPEILPPYIPPSEAVLKRVWSLILANA